jgi:hypothetical protein
LEPVIVEIKEVKGEVEITSSQPLQQIQLHNKKIAILKPINQTSIYLSADQNSTYELIAHKFPLPQRYENLTDE